MEGLKRTGWWGKEFQARGPAPKAPACSGQAGACRAPVAQSEGDSKLGRQEADGDTHRGQGMRAPPHAWTFHGGRMRVTQSRGGAGSCGGYPGAGKKG